MLALACLVVSGYRGANEASSPSSAMVRSAALPREHYGARPIRPGGLDMVVLGSGLMKSPPTSIVLANWKERTK